jgi:acetate kinase
MPAVGSSILAVNGGSSSLKCTLFKVAVGRLEQRSSFNISHVSGERDGHVAHLHQVLEQIRQRDDMAHLAAIGHRVVHGGDLFQEPVWLDDAVLADLYTLVALAPLHQPVNLKLIEICAQEFPRVPQLACFDTAFHQRMPDVARNYALPRSLTDAGIRAYGFHGISYEFIWSKLQTLDETAKDKRIVIAHLGAGVSLCAIKAGQSIATTMGFSTIDGMPMATRSGSVDPGVLIHLLREHGMTPDQLENLLYKKSGLQAISGFSGGMRELSASDEPGARAAIDFFVYRASREIASLAGALGGLDSLVFTGGIGANSASIRRAVCARCEWLGVDIDEEASSSAEQSISTPGALVDVWVIPTDEEAQIAGHAQRMLKSTARTQGPAL